MEEVKERVKKQVLVKPSLYRQMKARMYLLGKTFSDWLEAAMKEELKNEHRD